MADADQKSCPHSINLSAVLELQLRLLYAEPCAVCKSASLTQLLLVALTPSEFPDCCPFLVHLVPLMPRCLKLDHSVETVLLQHLPLPPFPTSLLPAPCTLIPLAMASLQPSAQMPLRILRPCLSVDSVALMSRGRF